MYTYLIDIIDIPEGNFDFQFEEGFAHIREGFVDYYLTIDDDAEYNVSKFIDKMTKQYGVGPDQIRVRVIKRY